MPDNQTRIPLRVDINRIIEVLASQIYPSPLALLRENTQNAFDAVLLRRQLSHDFTPQISIGITPNAVTIEDNGIGMTRSDLEEHFWKAGSSSKNTEQARAAGVVGTFGIGAMANFGIAQVITVETESAIIDQRTRSEAQRDTLSASEECISMIDLPPQGYPGTTIVATLDGEGGGFNVAEAEAYIREFIAYLPIQVTVNGSLFSQQDFAASVRPPPNAWDESHSDYRLTPDMIGTVSLRGGAAGEIWVSIDTLSHNGSSTTGRIMLGQGGAQMKTFRSGFGLATVAVSSTYQFGGIADLLFLEPTAGREALSTSSMQLLQTIVTSIDELVSERLGLRPQSDSNTMFMEWALRHHRFDLCEHLKMRYEPNFREMTLSGVRSSAEPLPYYQGTDQELIGAYSSDDKGLLVAAARNPRRGCEEGYISQFCKVTTVSDSPQVLETYDRSRYSAALWAVQQRLNSIIEQDYFLPNVISFGKMSHNLPLFVNSDPDPITITLDPASSSLSVLIGLYDSDYAAYPSMAKDFVRTIVFPRIKDLVPSSTRQGAEAFLKSISRHREIFQYEARDREELSSIWEDYLSGEITLGEATQRSVYAVRASIDVVTPSSARTIIDVVPDLLSNDAVLGESPDEDMFGPLPPMMRREIETDAKLLTIADDAQSLKGYRCFLALSEATMRDRGDFFLQPHTTEIVWGGQKTLFIFQHHSREFGLYYDVQGDGVVASESGGGAFPTCTIVLGNKVYIPIPDAISASFIPPADGRKRLEIRSDILYIEKRD